MGVLIIRTFSWFCTWRNDGAESTRRLSQFRIDLVTCTENGNVVILDNKLQAESSGRFGARENDPEKIFFLKFARQQFSDMRFYVFKEVETKNRGGVCWLCTHTVNTSDDPTEDFLLRHQQ